MALKIFEDIKLIRGYNRSLLVDYTMNTFEFIDSNLYDLLQELDGDNELDFSGFLSKYPLHDEKLRELYAKNVFNEFCTEDAAFPRISECVENPFAFQSITIYVSNLNVDLVIDNIEKLCNYTANIFFILREEFINAVLNLAQTNTENGTRYIFCSEETVLDTIKGTISKSVLAEYHILDFNIINDRIRYLKTWPSLDNNFFNFCESSTYNLGVFEKIYIDEFGNIKNNLHDDFTINSLFDDDIDNLEAIVKNNPNYARLANIKVDDIIICRDCEFRRMCVDIAGVKSTIYAANTYVKERECSYNPYISKWKSSPDYMSLEEIGVEADVMAFQIDHKKIEGINKDLWCD